MMNKKSLFAISEVTIFFPKIGLQKLGKILLYSEKYGTVKTSFPSSASLVLSNHISSKFFEFNHQRVVGLLSIGLWNAKNRGRMIVWELYSLQRRQRRRSWLIFRGHSHKGSNVRVWNALVTLSHRLESITIEDECLVPLEMHLPVRHWPLSPAGSSAPRAPGRTGRVGWRRERGRRRRVRHHVCLLRMHVGPRRDLEPCFLDEKNRSLMLMW